MLSGRQGDSIIEECPNSNLREEHKTCINLEQALIGANQGGRMVILWFEQ